MASGATPGLYRDLDLIAGAGTVAGLGDAELLGRFAGRPGDAAEAAFEAIVSWHGPMVLATCRRALSDPSDADDAFQATFLVLVRRARSVRVDESLGPWLFAVARRVAAKARAKSGRRRIREAPGVDPAALAAPDARESPAPEVGPVVDEELGRLPEKYRAPVVLCHLQGLTLAEAARRLGCPVGTVSGRLSRARALLRSRLARRGLGASAVAAILGAGEAGTVPPDLLSATARAQATLAGGGAVPDSILQLTRGVAIAMLMDKVKLAGIVAASAVAVLAVASGYVAGQGPKPGPGDPAKVETPPQAQEIFKRTRPDSQPSDPMAREVANQRRLIADSNAPEFTKRLRLAEMDRTAEFGSYKPEFGSTSSNGEILIVAAHDGRSARAMNLRMGRWEEYKVPGDARAASLSLYPNLAPLAFDGPEVRELAVFDGRLQRFRGVPIPGGEGVAAAGMRVRDGMGFWSSKALREPARGPIVPIHWEGAVLYQIDNDLYVYSSGHGWSDLHLTGAEPSRLSPAQGVILAQQGTKLYVYSIPAGRWVSEGEPPSPTPGGP